MEAAQCPVFKHQIAQEFLSLGPQLARRRATYLSRLDKKKSGAGEGIRTLDPNLGKVVLYP